MTLNFRLNKDGESCLTLRHSELKPGDLVEVRLVERKWIPLTFIEWSGNQHEDPVFEVTLPGGRYRRRLALPAFAEFRWPGSMAFKTSREGG